MSVDRGAREDFYRRYLDVCNAHDFDRLPEFIAPDISMNGDPVGAAGYIAGLKELVVAFPDFHWDLHQLIVDGDWLCSHLYSTGTQRQAFLGVPASGRVIRTQEFALYRTYSGLVREVWGTAAQLPLFRQTGESVQ